MDVFGCSGKPTRLEAVLFYATIALLALCVVLGLPFIVLVAVGVIG